MATSPRTFKVDAPSMQGDDIKSWKKEIKELFAVLDIPCPIAADGVWDISSRAFNASLCRALGMEAVSVMKEGVTPALRTRLRNRDLTVEEQGAFAGRVEYRRDLRDRWVAAAIKVHRPLAVLITDAWGFHPGVHDGIDVQTNPNAPLFAMVKSKIIDARSFGWWGANPSGVVSKGDGIVQMEILETVGPFKKGHHIGFGHCEKATVKEGDVVEAGDMVARCGLAVTWHVHLMMNEGNTNRGKGTYDPQTCLDFAMKNG